MEHWHKVLPPGVMIDVHYEDLVDDLEGTTRRALRHCGLDWEEACRDFHDTKRTVRTASLMQVRQPVYRRSIGTWRRYGEVLEPLGQALGLDIRAMLADASQPAASLKHAVVNRATGAAAQCRERADLRKNAAKASQNLERGDGS